MELAKSGKPKIAKDFFIYFLLPILLLGGTAALSVLIAYPAYKDLPVKDSELKALQEKDLRLDQKLKKLNDLTDFKEIVDEDLKLVNFALPSESEVPLLLTEVQQIAKESGLAIGALNYSSSGPNEAGDTSRVNVFLNAKGNFSQTKTFLVTLEKAARIVDISTIRFSSLKGASPQSLEVSEIDLSLGLTSPFLFVESKAVTEDPITIDIRDGAFVKFMNNLKNYKVYETVVDTSNIGKENPFVQ